MKTSTAYTFDGVILTPQFSSLRSRSEADTSFKFWNYDRTIPIISANMETITGSDMAISLWKLGGIGAMHRFWSVEKNVREYKRVLENQCNCLVSIGVNGGCKDRAVALYNAGARMFVVDIAHGHSVMMKETVGWLRDMWGDSICIVAGNVATASAVEDLVEWGADYVKVGIGPGGTCTTRVVTGHGYPAFSAIWNTCSVSDKIIADGGMKSSGDIVKSLAAGASSVMLGSMLSGTDETPGDVMSRSDGSKYKIYKGSASYDRGPGVAKEGIETEVPYKGSIKSVVEELVAGIRSGMSYSNARTLEELVNNSEFMLQTIAGYAEGLPHVRNRG